MSADEPIERQTLAARTYARLRHEIESRVLDPGQRLDEQALCDRLGVSRTPLRQALQRLAQDGLIVQVPYQGNFVRSFGADEVNDLYVVRSALEQLAVRLAVDQACDDMIAQIRELATECKAVLKRGEISRLNTIDQLFHAAIAEASGNAVLVRLLGQLRSPIHAIRTFANEDIRVAMQTIDERLLICDALEERDADTAARLLAAHIDGVRASVVTGLSSTPATQEDT